MLRTNLNPILDEGAPTYTRGVENASRLADMLGIPLMLDMITQPYLHGWGKDCAIAKPVQYQWKLTLNDVRGQPTTFSFDLVQGVSPLIIGLDKKRNADTLNRSKTRRICFQRPCDTVERVFHTYIAKDESRCSRLWMEIVPHEGSTTASLMSNIKRRQPLNIEKEMHRFTHGTSKEMISLLKDAGLEGPEYKRACQKVFDSCGICASSVRPADKAKVSLAHVNKSFNSEIQADFVTVYIRDEKFEVINIIDVGTRYGERSIAPCRDGRTMMEIVETRWLYQHGDPKRFSADPEFCKEFFKRFLDSYDIHLMERPSRSSSKNGVVERNNGTFKLVLNKLAKELTSASPATLLARASFMCNLFHGNSVMSAFQLARGYSPSIAGIPSYKVLPTLVDAQIRVNAARAVQRALRSKSSRVVQCAADPPGTHVWVFYKSWKQNEPVKWVPAAVVETKKCRRSKRGTPMSVAYEDIRIAPEGDLAQELVASTLEEFMSRTDGDFKGEPSEAIDPVGERVLGSFFSSSVVGFSNKDIGIGLAHGPDLSKDHAFHLESTEK